MEAKRLILETDAAGNLKQLPKLPPNQQVGVIVLMLTNFEEAAPKRRIPQIRLL